MQNVAYHAYMVKRSLQCSKSPHKTYSIVCTSAPTVTMLVRIAVVLVQVCCLVCSFQVRSAMLRSSFQRNTGKLKMQQDSTNHFDFLVIGGGSGGIASARRAANYGAKVAIIEKERLGGTCVNVGCVPKKVMFNAATVAETLRDAKHFGFSVKEMNFDWRALKDGRDKYVSRLNAIYRSTLDNNKIRVITGTASFNGANSVEVDGCTYSADNVLIAVGGRPSLPSEADVPGVRHCISSDGFFSLEMQPKRVAIVGGGYIAVELAGVLNALGSETHVFTRRDKFLNEQFDTMVVDVLGSEMKKQGVLHFPNQECKEVIKNPQDGTLTILTRTGDLHGPFDQVLFATGRVAETGALNLPAAGITDECGMRAGYIAVDQFQNTVTKGVYALGDVCGQVELTPMAIAAGRRLADRLFGGAEQRQARADYEDVPTVVFSHPPIGVCGMSEDAAVLKYGRDQIRTYTSSFTNLFYGTFPSGGPGEADTRPKTAMKLVTLLPDEKVLGVHLIGMGSDEILQGFAVAMKMGATKADLDRCVAIHPTAAEELVTMAPWGLASQPAAAAPSPQR